MKTTDDRTIGIYQNIRQHASDKINHRLSWAEIESQSWASHANWKMPCSPHVMYIKETAPIAYIALYSLQARLPQPWITLHSQCSLSAWVCCLIWVITLIINSSMVNKWRLRNSWLNDFWGDEREPVPYWLFGYSSQMEGCWGLWRFWRRPSGDGRRFENRVDLC